jgi:hypothetical protein
MTFSSRTSLISAVTGGCLISLVAYFVPLDSRLPWLADVILPQLRAGRVSAVWLLPGCLLGLWTDRWASAWFGVCVGGWLLSAGSVARYELAADMAQSTVVHDVLEGWPVAMLFAFYTFFFFMRIVDRSEHLRYK